MEQLNSQSIQFSLQTAGLGSFGVSAYSVCHVRGSEAAGKPAHAPVGGGGSFGAAELCAPSP